MNNILADILGVLNGIVAIITIAAGALVGGFYGENHLQFNIFTSLIGGLAGLLFATIIFGGLAVLICIRNELRKLNRGKKRNL